MSKSSLMHPKQTEHVSLLSVSHTNLTSRVPQGHGVVVGGVGPGAGWIDATQLLHVMLDVSISCGGNIHRQEQSYPQS